MTSTEIRIPLTEIKVRFRSGTQRPITELDRLVMQAVHAGASSVNGLKPIFQLPERLLVESLVDLMEMALLALDFNGGGFRLTAFGEQVLEQGLTCFGERVDDADEMTFLREDWAGRMASGQIVRYDRVKGDAQSQAVLATIPHGEIEQLLIREIKKQSKHKHLYSVESIVPVRDGISFRVTVAGTGISGLPSQWGHLKPQLQAEAEKRTGVRFGTLAQERGDEQDEPFWTDASIEASDLLLDASAHQAALSKAMEEAHSHLLVLSAHVSEQVLKTITEPLKRAIERGVRVDVLYGLPSLDEGREPHAKTVKKWLQEMRGSLADEGDRLTANEEALDIDAKVLIWDTQNGVYHAIVGSYNWLYGLDGSAAGRVGSDVGVRLSHPQLVGSMCTTLSGWLDARGQRLSGVSLRWRQLGLLLQQKDTPVPSGSDASVTKARVIYDESHAGVLREGLVNATSRLLVSSHKLNRSATGMPDRGGGKLDWLARKKPDGEFLFVLVAGKEPKQDNWTADDQKRLEHLVNGIGGTMRIGTGTHARVLVYDDIAVISGYNFLSTTHDKRQIGVMFQGGHVADALWNAVGP